MDGLCIIRAFEGVELAIVELFFTAGPANVVARLWEFDFLYVEGMLSTGCLKLS